jgi:hypothetical protein
MTLKIPVTHPITQRLAQIRPAMFAPIGREAHFYRHLLEAL